MSEVSLTHSSRRVNILLQRLGGRRYLEIGVFGGSTFLGVEAEQKTAVDPKFHFDFRAMASEQVRFFEVPSDRYFSNLHDGNPFDIVFLDGLHTFEQTFRDFCSSLSCCTDRTVWLIDDTLPSDIYSAWPVQREAVKLREASGGTGGAWHGDVFKIVFAIHDFFPMLSYCTINTGGNPQTLVWRQARADFAPRFNSLEAISRLGYFDLQREIALMCLTPEQEALNRVVAVLTPGER